MGAIDEYLRALVAPQLQAGEVVQGCAHAREPTQMNLLQVPERNDNWLMVLTNHRLFFFRTKCDGMWDNKPRREATDPKVFGLDDLAHVETKVTHYGQIVPGGPPTMLALRPHPHCGPFQGQSFRVDLYGVAEGLDEQHRIATTFPGWLAQQVAAGAYPMSPEKRAWLEAEVARKAAEYQRHLAEQAAKAAEFNRKLGPRLLAVGWFLGLCALGFLIFVGTWETRQFSANSDREKYHEVKKQLARIENGEMPNGETCSKKEPRCGPCVNDKFKNDPAVVGKGYSLAEHGYKSVKADGAKWWCDARDTQLNWLDESASKREGSFQLALGKLIGGIVGFGAWIGVFLVVRRRAKKAAETKTTDLVAPPTAAPGAMGA